MYTNMKRWLDPEELESEFGISQSSQSKMRMRKKIPFSKIGAKYIRYDRLKINLWLEEHSIEEI